MVAGAAAAASDILARIDAKGLISDSLQTVVSVANLRVRVRVRVRVSRLS